MKRRPDVVGQAEAAEILGIPAPVVNRWKKSGRMPPPAAEGAATTLWHREDIDIMAVSSDGEWRVSRRKSGRQPQRLELLGTSEVADLLGVNKSQIGRWKRTDSSGFPAPAVDRPQIAAGPFWWRKDIEAWQQARERVAA